MTEDYTPSILIEPPTENPALLLVVAFALSVPVSFGPTSSSLFDNSYPSSSESSSECYSQPPALFIHQPDTLSISTELDAYLQTDKFGYSPCTSGRSSPVGAWSPASTFSGEVFPDDFTHEEYWPATASLSSHSSPALSPSSLSPLFDGFALADNDSYAASTERSLLDGPPAFSRLRSSSHSGPSTELWADSGVGRGRSSSFSGATDSQFFPSAPAFTDASSVSISVATADVGFVQTSDVGFSDALGTSMSWGVPETNPQLQLGGLSAGWRYPGRDGPSVDTQELSPPPLSPSLLTVPGAGMGLRRRGAVSARRTLSHSDIPAALGEVDLGRGRGIHRSTLSIPNSRSSSNHSSHSSYSHSRSPSRDSSYGSSSDFGYSPTMPSSPAFEDAEADADADEPISIGRRQTFTAMRGTREGFPATAVPLSRAISAPSGSSRSRRTRGASASVEGLGVFKAEQQLEGNAFLFPDGAGSEQPEFRIVQQSTSTPFKAEVASKKIRQASNARRLNAAAFACPLEHCTSTFTARHNLINHINSHNKHRPHKCPCGMSFTTQGVLNRHKKRCRQ